MVLKFRAIRLAVNLCVIGALLLPGGGLPTATGAVPHSAADGKEKCQGCGHCSVSKPGDRCGCCSKNQPAQVANEKPVQRTGCCKRLSASPVTKNKAPQRRHSICLCGQESQPAAPTPQNRSATEQLIKLLLISPVGDVVVATDAERGLFTEQSSASLLPRESQRRLCVWLL